RRTGRRNDKRARRAPAAQQRTVPCSRNSQRKDQRTQRRAGGSRNRQENAAAGERVQAGDQGRQAPGRTQIEAQDLATLGQIPTNTSVPLVPPNPNEFDSAGRIRILRAVFATYSSEHCVSLCC